MPDVVPETAADATVEVVFDFGQHTFGEYDYAFVEALMRGTVERDDGSTGEYEVPIRLAYPRGGGNRIGVVEPANSGLFLRFANDEGVAHDCGRGPVDECEDGETTGRLIQNLINTHADRQAGGYMFREGFTYLAIGWDKSVTDQLGPEPADGTTRRRLAYGTIEEGSDRVTIFRDASDWLRDPSGFEGHGAPDVPAQDHVVAFGMSQSAAVLGTFFRAGQNETEDGGVYFDGFLGMSGLWFCIAEEQIGPNWALLEPCSGPVPPGDAKLLHFESQADVDMGIVASTRDPNHGTEDESPNHVQWEAAGVAHVSPTMLDLTNRGLDGQNPIDFDAIFRAAFHHMANWLTEADYDPPPTNYIEGGPEGELPWVTATDDDGNALGGVRLPHMPRVLEDGTVIGAPVGVYGGFDFDAENLLLGGGGFFERFHPDRIAEEYPTREAYAERYLAAVDALVDEGYILEEDYELYRARAEGIAIPEPPADPGLDHDEQECFAHSCPEHTGIHLPEGGEVRLELVYRDRWAPELRTHAWFASDQEPDSRPWPRDPANWHIRNGDDLCQDLRDGSYFPAGEVESRSYIDVGETVTFSAGSSEIQLGKKLNSQDDVTFRWHDILYIDHISASEAVAGAEYDVRLSGSDGFPETAFTEALRLPPDPELSFPNFDEIVIIPLGNDFRFIADNREEPHEFDFTFVGFSDPHGPVGFCVGPPTAAITIPQEFLERMPSGGEVQYGFLNHRVETLEGRRIDFVGMNSREARYLIDRGHR